MPRPVGRRAVVSFWLAVLTPRFSQLADLDDDGRAVRQAAKMWQRARPACKLAEKPASGVAVDNRQVSGTRAQTEAIRGNDRLGFHQRRLPLDTKVSYYLTKKRKIS
jgi:hypothetical protein